MGPKAKYIPWLFDSRDAFEKTVNDSRYRYQMPFSQFMAIYNEYRRGIKATNIEILSSSPISKSSVSSSSKASESDSSSAAGQILTQEEIDQLIAKSIS